ncbi:hypothetical protein HNY73_009013 [Argiope bruennichi]|uniref:Uncharacterized protein n=1 Tax=Argiope bruennichi TaxID=94029 RepID=A0A8T0FAI6_ARGBR|nr:hypothetical protein HNY73_009013 [Argiope bruennichi]
MDISAIISAVLLYTAGCLALLYTYFGTDTGFTAYMTFLLSLLVSTCFVSASYILYIFHPRKYFPRPSIIISKFYYVI